MPIRSPDFNSDHETNGRADKGVTGNHLVNIDVAADFSDELSPFQKLDFVRLQPDDIAELLNKSLASEAIPAQPTRGRRDSQQAIRKNHSLKRNGLINAVENEAPGKSKSKFLREKFTQKMNSRELK